jgi:pSer/pThr/pTyr-binding forkhead associated (FHA) protein
MTSPRPEQATSARLLVFVEDAVHRAIELTQKGLTIGRGPANDLVLADADRLVSRFHAEVRWENGRYVLLDLGSQNGTWMDERRVDRVELQPGLLVVIGPYRLIFDDTPID